MKRRYWTGAERDTLRARYPDTPTDRLARDMGRSASSLYGMAELMGIRKSEAYLASPAACRMRRAHSAAGKAHRFQPGHAPWNKGRSFDAGGRSVATQFQKGQMTGAARHNYRPIGSTRITYGNLERKITDDPSIYAAKRWRAVHRLVWEAEHGPVPRGHLVVFRRGCHTAVEAEITLGRLECISRAENMRRNTIHRYPKELVSTIRILTGFNRKLKHRSEQ